jgi:CHASE3 domain sensor protein
MTHYQSKLDPNRLLLNDVLIGKLKELSVLFEQVISTADHKLVAF